MSATMGEGLVAFVGIWTVMMAAMMLPAVAPTATLYVKTIRSARPLRVGGYVGAYIAVWAITGVPAYLLARGADALAADHRFAAHVATVVVFGACGVYQLTPLKDRCLAHCRSPLSLLLHYGSFRGRSRDLRAGAHHGLYCLGCCWTLMVVLLAVGIMNLWVMAVLAAVIAGEKLWSRGPQVARAAGVLALALAVAAIRYPALAPGLHHHVMSGRM
ncbi:MAG: hypothetical protein NVSMB12_17470 [Acidimicrobiales bacterium]